MFIVKTGAWNDIPVEYVDCQDYLARNGESLERYVNDYLADHRPDLPRFAIDDGFRKYFERYVRDHAAEQWVLNKDGSYDSHRLSNLSVEAVANYLGI